MQTIQTFVGLLAATLALISASCDSKKSAPVPAKTSETAAASPAAAPAASPAAPPAASPAAPTPSAVAVLDQSETIPGLQVAVKMPSCTALKTTPGYAASEPPTALIQPKDPSCRAFGVMGVAIRDAESDYGSRDKAEPFVAKNLHGEHIVITDLADGYRVAYERPNALSKRTVFGVIVARKVGARTIHCRGEGNPDELKNIEAVCASLTLAP
jgi:hypothetical protein